MPINKAESWLTIAVIAFFAGIVTNILVPARRGLWGFASSAIVSVFCGGVAGITAHAFNLPEGVQFLVAAGVGVFGDRFLVLLLSLRFGTNGSINIYGGNNQNAFGDDGGFEQSLHADANACKLPRDDEPATDSPAGEEK